MNRAAALRKIEAELREIAAQADEVPIDAHQVRLIAVKIAAQAEILEQDLDK